MIMNKILKVLTLFCFAYFMIGCFSNDPIEKIEKYNGKYEGALNTRENIRQIIPNKCTLIVNDDNSIDITITGGNKYDDQLTILKSELTKTEDNIYYASKNSKNYTFAFYSDYMNLTIENNDNTITEGKLSKMN